jgi:hypothetical protein
MPQPTEQREQVPSTVFSNSGTFFLAGSFSIDVAEDTNALHVQADPDASTAENALGRVAADERVRIVDGVDGNLAKESLRDCVILSCVLFQGALAHVLASALQAPLRLGPSCLYWQGRFDFRKVPLASFRLHDHRVSTRRARGVREIRRHRLLEVAFPAE